MRERLRQLLPDVAVLLILLVGPLILFFPQTIGSKTLLPIDNLYQFEPYASEAEAAGLLDESGRLVPQNALLSDLILQNLAWRQFINQQVGDGEIPLWQPHITGGGPFLAAGQSLPIHPFSLLFLILPLAKAYGWYTVLVLWVAGINMYVLARVFGIRRPGALVSALTYQLSGFFLVSVVFPMILATAVWLPLVLAFTELTIRAEPIRAKAASLPWIAGGAIALGLAGLAGHAEALYFTLLVMAFYALVRLIALLLHRPEGWTWGQILRPAGGLVALVALGLALSAVQLLPSYELVVNGFREGRTDFATVLSFGYPTRRVLTFLLPNFFGNPAHHAYFDLFTWSWTPVSVNAAGGAINNTSWGIKNYVEGGAYLGLLPMALALLASLQWLASRLVPRPSYMPEYRPGMDLSELHKQALRLETRHIGVEMADRPYRLTFMIMALLSTTFVFGTPTYALLYYGLPFFSQSHSPFRWVWPLSLAIAVLAGFGVELIQRATSGTRKERRRRQEIAEEADNVFHRWVAIVWFRAFPVLAYGSLIAGGLSILGLVVSRVAYGALEGTIQSLFEGLALAPTAFADGRMFYSYQAGNVLIFALMALLSGGTLLLAYREAVIEIPERLRRFVPRYEIQTWVFLAPLVVLIDLLIPTWGFHPAVDANLLERMPDSIRWLQENSGIQSDLEPGRRTPRVVDPSQLARFIAYEEPGADTMNSNIGWLHGLHDASGYDSLIVGDYADYMRTIHPQGDLLFNRIAPIYSHHAEALDSPLLDALNVRYVVSEVEIDNPKYELAFEDEAVFIYENLGALPRAYTMPFDATVYTFGEDPRAELAEAVSQYDVRHYTLLHFPPNPLADPPASATEPAAIGPAAITVYESREVWIDVAVEERSWLILGDSMFPGWRAFVRPLGSVDQQEEEFAVETVNGLFRGVVLPPGDWTVRFNYNP
ncbi:MAG: YfhO family protein, partial [Chloroflexi bacterium]|nr:YfhO family protein [Chloroflexota bacterium]